VVTVGRCVVANVQLVLRLGFLIRREWRKKATLIRRFKDGLSLAAEKHLLFLERSKGVFFLLLSPTRSSSSSFISASLSFH